LNELLKSIGATDVGVTVIGMVLIARTFLEYRDKKSTNGNGAAGSIRSVLDMDHLKVGIHNLSDNVKDLGRNVERQTDSTEQFVALMKERPCILDARRDEN